MDLVVLDKLLQIYDILPSEFTMQDLMKMLSSDFNYHTVRAQLLCLVEHGALHKAKKSYHKNFRTITGWFREYIKDPIKVKALS